jgi:hypothetical protein
MTGVSAPVGERVSGPHRRGSCVRRGASVRRRAIGRDTVPHPWKDSGDALNARIHAFRRRARACARDANEAPQGRLAQYSEKVETVGPNHRETHRFAARSRRHCIPSAPHPDAFVRRQWSDTAVATAASDAASRAGVDRFVRPARFTTEHAMMKLAANSAVAHRAEPVTRIPAKSEARASPIFPKTTSTARETTIRSTCASAFRPSQ